MPERQKPDEYDYTLEQVARLASQKVDRLAQAQQATAKPLMELHGAGRQAADQAGGAVS